MCCLIETSHQVSVPTDCCQHHFLGGKKIGVIRFLNAVVVTSFAYDVDIFTPLLQSLFVTLDHIIGLMFSVHVSGLQAVMSEQGLIIGFDVTCKTIGPLVLILEESRESM